MHMHATRKGDALKPPVEVPVEAKAFVPADQPEIEGMETEKQAVALTMDTGIPSLFIGHTGTAKTTMLRRMHEEAGWPYRGISGRESIEVDNLMGKWRFGDSKTMEFHLGILPFCMKYGIAVGIQEINFIAPEVLVLLHEYVDEGFITMDELSPGDEDFIIKPHPNFRLYGTMNPPELYPGARELSPALLRRCMVRHVEDLERDAEVRVLLARVKGLAHDWAREMVEVAASLRENFHNRRSSYYCSTADLVMWGQLALKSDPITSSEFAVVGKASPDDHIAVRGRVRLSFNPTDKSQPATTDDDNPPF